MNLDYEKSMAPFGPVVDHTPEQIARMRDLTADQPDAVELLAAMGIGGEE